MIFALFIPFLESKLYTQYTPSVGSNDLCLLEIMHYEASREDFSSLLPTNESMSQGDEIIRNNSALKIE